MPTPLKILIAEDSEDDVELIVGELRRVGFSPQWQRVETEAAFLDELHKGPDIVLSDYAMPQFNGLRAAELALASGLNIPFILISGTVGEEAAVEAMKLGVADYLLKDRLARLGNAVEQALNRKKLRHQQKVAEAALRESEEKFSRMFDSSPVATSLTTLPDGRYLDANTAWLKLFEWSRDEVLGRTVAELNIWADPARRATLLAELQQHDTVQDFEMELRTKSGRRVQVSWSGTRVVIGGESCLMGSALDITERKRAVSALEESQRFLQSTVNALASHIAILDEQGDIVEVNAAWQRFARENNAIRQHGVGENYLHVCDAAAGRFSEEATTVASGIRTIISGGSDEFHLEYPCHSPQQKRWFIVRATRFAGAGPVRVVMAHENITERKLAEAALIREHGLHQALLDNLPDHIFFKDRESRFTRINRALAHYLGLKSPEESLGKSDADFFPVHAARQTLVDERRLMATGTPLLGLVEKLEIGGGIKWVSTTKVPLHDRAGNLIGLVGVSRDITENMLATTALRESRAVYHSLVSQLPVGIFQKDLAGRYVLVNPEFCRLKGTSPEHFLGKMPSEVAESERLQRDPAKPGGKYARLGEEQHRLILATGKSLAMDEEYLQLDGRKHFVHAMKLPVLDADGQVIGSQGVLFDITGRKQDEEQLRKLSRAVEQSPVMALITDVNGTIEYVNQAYTAVTGYRSEEVVGKNPRILKSGRTPRVVYQQLWATITSGRTWNGELHNRKKDGTLFWEWDTISPLLDSAGNITHFIAVKEDITERKQKEQSHILLATAVEQAAETIIITDPQGAILYANPAFEKTTGYTRAEVLGNNPRFLKSGQQDEDFYRQLWAAIERGETWHGHFINQRKDGTKFEEDATISPVRDAAGTIVNYVAVKRDVTREIQLEDRMRQAQKMEAIGTLAGGIAHDFNNILAAMFGYGYLLRQDTEGNAVAQEDLAEIFKAANRAKDLVQQILTFSRQREQKRQIVRLDSVVKEAMKFLRASLPAQIKIEVVLAEDAPTVLADPTQIYQVTMNLATNALHAMEDRPGQLTVRLDPFQPEAEFLRAHLEFQQIEYARLTVADTGHGMDAKTVARIFEPFFTTKPVGKGTGLGLAVVHGIVQSHDGLLTVESQIGQGTTFQLYFPAQTSSAEPLTDVAGDMAPGQGQHILLLDDEPALTRSLCRLLERLSYRVTTSNHAREAVALFNANPAQFDLLITDMTMPEMNGLEVARQCHTLRPELPVILASGLTSNLTSENLLAAGICDLLEKPLAITALAGALQRALAKT
jgi:PAS domain S-box-containing protein